MILASQSPRRRELLSQLTSDFRVVVADVDETLLPGEVPERYVLRLAELKARTVAHEAGPDEAVIAADTTVSVSGQILNKPIDKADFLRMMSVLSGQTHQVYTGLCVIQASSVRTAVVCTDVAMRPLTQSECECYWLSGEPQDKAGGYGIQGLAARFVRRIEGSYTNVVGLPLVELEALLSNAP
jgi:septum formation protein